MSVPIKLASVEFSGIDLARLHSLLTSLIECGPTTRNERIEAAKLRRRIIDATERHIKEHGE
jgi:hypothetical protein